MCRLNGSKARQRASSIALAVGTALGSARLADAQVKAFPEAEGFGRFATGARTNLASANVYHVTNLNDTGAGSFRDAVSQSNRFIVFDVGGIARINSVVTFASNITIAGQTAPGGFQVYGNRVAFHNATNLISRYWGARNAATNDNDAASLASGQNMIWDHMSISWGRDGTFDINPDTGAIIDNLTIQNTIIAQGLQASNHSTGGLMTLTQDRNFSIIKSLFADNKTRNPKARGNNEFINNVTYGWTGDGYIMGDTVNEISRANVEGNYAIRGPLASSGPFTNGTAEFEIYGNDNYFDSNQNGVLDGAVVTSYPGATVVATRHAFPTTSVMSAQDALAFVLDNVGASITRDVVDTNIITEVSSYGTLGGLIVRETDVYPNYDTDAQYVKPRARLVDADNDGMPDNWETSRGYNPGNGTDWKTLNGSYTRLEDYLNELGGYVNTKSAIAGGAWTNGASWGGTVPDFSTTAVATGGITHSSGNGFARQLTLDGASIVSGGTLDVFDTALIGAAGVGSLGISGGTVSAGQIVLGAAGQSGTLTLTGGTLQTGTITGGGGTASLVLNGGTIRFTGVPNITVATTVAAGGATLNTNGFSGSITGGLTGSGTITKTGNGTLTLGGNNSAYSGAINLNAGTITNASAITLATNGANSSTGVITAANGTQINVTASGASTPLTLASGAAVTITAGGLTYNGAINGPAGTTLIVSNSSSGTSNFSIGGNLSSFAGTLDLATSTGNIRIGAGGSSLANFDAGDSTGTFRTSNDGTTNFGSLSGGVNTRLQGSTNGTVASTYVIGANGNSTTFAGTISNGTNTTPAPVNIVKTGTGTLTLSGANTYTGGNTVSAGTLRLNGASAMGASGAALTVNGGTLDLNGFGQTVSTLSGSGGTITSGTAASLTSNAATDSTFAGAINGSISLTKNGAGTLALIGTSSNYTGVTNIGAGVLAIASVANAGSASSIGSAGVASSNLVIGTGATLRYTGNSASTNRGLTAGGTIEVTNPATTLEFSGLVNNNTLTKTGPGTLKLSGVDQIGFMSFVASAGTTIFAKSQQTCTTNLTINSGATVQLAPPVANSQFWWQAPITINAGGTLDLKGQSDAAWTLAGAGTITNSAAATTSTFTISNNGSFSGTIQNGAGAVALNKTGAPTATLSGPLTYSGATNVSGGGKLILQSNLTSTSSVTVNGATLELAGGAGGGRVIKTPTVSITGGGKLNLTDNKLITNTAVGTASGGIYTGVQRMVQQAHNGGGWDGTTGITTSQPDATTGLTTIGVSTGALARSLGPADTDLFAGQIINGNSTLVMYTYAGDANLDGFIDGTDYFYIDSNVGTSADGYGNGDFNYDGSIDGTDYFFIDSNITSQGAPFSTSGLVGLSVIAVPEPGACLGVAGLLGINACRRRRRMR